MRSIMIMNLRLLTPKSFAESRQAALRAGYSPGVNIQTISNSLESCQARSNMVIFFKRGSSSFTVTYKTIIMTKATHCQSVDV